jgi:hypothetical protein
MERDRINARAYGSNVTTNTGGQFGYNRLLVNPTREYKLAMIVENNAVPASSTDWRIHLVNVMDATRFDVSPRVPGSTDGSKAFPTWSTGGTVGVTGTVVLGAGSAAVGTVTPRLTSVTAATIMSLETSATGATYAVFGAQACTSLDLINATTVDIEYRRGGAGVALVIPRGSARLITGITNANQISIRRVDTSNTVVTVTAEALT